MRLQDNLEYNKLIIIIFNLINFSTVGVVDETY